MLRYLNWRSPSALPSSLAARNVPRRYFAALSRFFCNSLFSLRALLRGNWIGDKVSHRLRSRVIRGESPLAQSNFGQRLAANMRTVALHVTHLVFHQDETFWRWIYVRHERNANLKYIKTYGHFLSRIISWFLFLLTFCFCTRNRIYLKSHCLIVYISISI